MRALLALSLLSLAAGAAAAQGANPAGAAPARQDTKAPATKAAPGGTRGTSAPATKTPATKTPATRTANPNTKVIPQGRRQALTVAPEAPPDMQVPVIMREAFDYDAGGRRDPFYSLLSSPDLRPTVTDLNLVGILYDESGRRPVAVMRDLTTKAQYRVTTGSTLGRMRVSLITRRAVFFTIEEFGLNRQDSLVLRDTTKARAK